MFKSPKIIISSLLVVVIILTFGCVFLACQSRTNVSGPDIINQAWDYLFSNYIDQTKLNADNMTEAAIEGILNTINDPHMAYMTKAEYDDFMSGLQGQYVGIGVVVSAKDDKIVIVQTLFNSPAEKAGLKANDTILKVDGESVAGLSLEEATAKMLGRENTSVELVILHQGETEPVTMVITRAKLDVPTVFLKMYGDIAYIYLAHFTEHSEDELGLVIKQVKEVNAKGIVLDVRGNTGGYLDVAIQIASNFITEGVVVKVKNSDGTMDIYTAATGLETTDLPMILLVDNYSASASEVLAGALQDRGRAIIAGVTTYGKGSVNNLYQLSDGSGIYITTGRWLTPNDRLIEGQGIVPDFPLDMTEEEELQWAIDYLSNN